MTNITKQDIASIGIKLLAIYAAIQAINLLPIWMMTFSYAFGLTSSNDTSFPLSYKLAVIFLPLLMLLIPILLWIFSDKIAQFAAKSRNSNLAISANLQDLQGVLFCAVGLFIFIITVPELIVMVYAYIHAHMTTLLTQPAQIDTPKVVTLSLKAILSLLLIFTAKNLSKLLYKLRYAGHKK